MIENKDYSKELVTRICHDLAGGIGAVSSCLSLISEIQAVDKETMDLANENAESLLSRLRFFRAVFGNDGAVSDSLSAKKILEDYLKTLENKRVCFPVEWQVDNEIPLFVFRLILLSAFSVVGLFILGAKIDISCQAGTQLLEIKMTGKTIIGLDAFVDVVQNKQEIELTTKSVHFFVLSCFLQEHNCSLDISEIQDGFVLKVAKKQ